MLDVFDTAQQRLAADEALLAVMDNIAAARCRIVVFQCAKEIGERDAKTGQPVRIGLDLERLIEATVRVDLGDTRHLAHARRDLPFEDRAQLHRRQVLGAHLELQNFAECRRERVESRRAVTSGDLLDGIGQPLGDELARTINVRAFAEDHRDGGDAKL